MAITEEAMRDSNLPEKQMKEARMREIFMLLEHLVSHEEITIKLIIDCLYDVGSVNLINQRVRQSFLRPPLKGIAGVSKPVAKIIAFRWFKRNCPQVITNWLYAKVAFPLPAKLPSPVSPSQVVAAEQTTLIESAKLNQEVQRLRGQVRLLSGISIGAIAALSGVLVWMNQRPEMQSSHHPVQPVQAVDAEPSKSSSLLHQRQR